MKLPLQQYYHLLGQYLWSQGRRVFLMSILLLLGIVLQLVNPQIMRFFIDEALAGSEMRLLLQAALLFWGVAIVNQILAIWTTYISEQVAWAATNALRLDLVAHCLRLDMSFHKTRTPGELIERIDGDVNALSNFFSRFTIDILGNAVLLVGVLGLLFREDWRAGFGFTIFAIFALWILLRIRTFAVPFWKQEREVNARFYGFLSEHLTATADLRANGAVGYIMYRFRGGSELGLHF
ncbi:ABC transporter ATP-binding protein [Chloroflexi bacterium TSY]|nr:ABC transporter ATP-binding protein [Chloroflexi bacterium TSY]